ncbi:lytic transglycosylase domain-containing protein [Acidisoma sp. L85]|uniref:lytic transglycosylase domain-containing protein n=1 Tax=Acidisoma sp. L85 TaxID=1641850 RepID=UPI00131BA9AC|nr:lytic transglycosylase domain-containing protein [Acidisoma sp. L85]
MTRSLILAVALCLLPLASRASSPPRVVGCIQSAASVYQLPPAVILILLSVEDGSLGRVSQNTNRTVDIGPMQVNSIWVPAVARHWRASQSDTYAALKDSFCANVEAGSWILRQAMDEAHGDFWEGVGFYHSHDPGYVAAYLRKVLRQTLQLQAQALRETKLSHQAAAGG